MSFSTPSAGMTENTSAAGKPIGPFPIAIPTGDFRIDAESDLLIRQISQGPPGDGITAHPIFGFIASVGGLGIPIGTVFAWCGGSIAAGPLLASCDLRIARPLQVGITYQIKGQLLGLETKASRRFGRADHIALRIDIGRAEVHYSRLELTIVVPKGMAT